MIRNNIRLDIWCSEVYITKIVENGVGRSSSLVLNSYQIRPRRNYDVRRENTRLQSWFYGRLKVETDSFQTKSLKGGWQSSPYVRKWFSMTVVFPVLQSCKAVKLPPKCGGEIIMTARDFYSLGFLHITNRWHALVVPWNPRYEAICFWNDCHPTPPSSPHPIPHTWMALLPR